jgi:hypothetical protein
VRLLLIVKTRPLSLLFHALFAGRAPRRVDRLRRAPVFSRGASTVNAHPPFVAEEIRA